MKESDPCDPTTIIPATAIAIIEGAAAKALVTVAGATTEGGAAGGAGSSTPTRFASSC